ncbi:MAG: hypothetical protein NTY09_02870 [bacterium]|nr:hypothetical protein [bacterium]
MKTKPEILYRVRTNYPILVAAFVGISLLYILFWIIWVWWYKHSFGPAFEPREVEEMMHSFLLEIIYFALLGSVVIALQSPRLTLTAFKDYLLLSRKIFETRPKKIYPREIVKIAGINESTDKIYPFKGYMGSHPKLLISNPEPLEQNCTHLYLEATTGNYVFKMKDACEVAKRLSEIYPNVQ